MFEQNCTNPFYSLNQTELESAKKIHVLDGINSGMVAWIRNEGHFLENNGKTLFKNYKILESTLIAKGYTPLDYDILFLIEDGPLHARININSSRFNPETHLWEGYPFDVNGRQGHYYNKLLLKEVYVDNVSCIGYIQYNESDAEYTDKKQIYKKQKKIQTIVQECASVLATYPHYGIFVNTDEYDNFCINLVGSTAKVHICTNQFVMNFNDKRRKSNLRCLPFIKGKNKYGTLYVYASIDENERDEIKTRAYNLIDALVLYMDQCFPELEIKFEDVIFKGYIEIQRKED